MNYRRILLGVSVGFVVVFPATSFAFEATSPVVCTMEAKMCPDGSYVGRVGPSCEFQACGGVSTPPKPPYSPAMPPVFNEVIKRGASGDNIKDIQVVLKSDPAIYNGPVSGYYGAMTEVAIKKLQAKYGLSQTGIIDSATRAILFPSNPLVNVVIVSPNGGETWKAGDVQHISWKTTFSPVGIPVTMGGTNTMDVTTTSAGSAGAPVSQDRIIMTTGTELRAMPVPMPEPTPMPKVLPFFSRGTLELVKDSDVSFSRLIGTVNLYDTTRAWKIPASIPEAKDYRVRITVGAHTPCAYRNEIEASATGRAVDMMIINPCPMTSANTVSASPLYYPTYTTTDQSDGTFVISGGTANNTDIAALKRKIAELENIVLKLQEELARVKEAVNALR